MVGGYYRRGPGARHCRQAAAAARAQVARWGPSGCATGTTDVIGGCCGNCLQAVCAS